MVVVVVVERLEEGGLAGSALVEAADLVRGRSEQVVKDILVRKRLVVVGDVGQDTLERERPVAVARRLVVEGCVVDDARILLSQQDGHTRACAPSPAVVSANP